MSIFEIGDSMGDSIAICAVLSSVMHIVRVPVFCMSGSSMRLSVYVSSRTPQPSQTHHVYDVCLRSAVQDAGLGLDTLNDCN